MRSGAAPPDRAQRDAVPRPRRRRSSRQHDRPSLPGVRAPRRVRRTPQRRAVRPAPGAPRFRAVPRRRRRDRGRGRRPLPFRPTEDPRRPPIRSAAAASSSTSWPRMSATSPATSSCSPRPRAVRFGRRCSAGGPGSRRSAKPASRRCDRTTFAIPRWRCGSRPARPRTRSLEGPGTRRAQWCSTGTATCCRTPRSASRTRSTISVAPAPRAHATRSSSSSRAKNARRTALSATRAGLPRPAAPALTRGDRVGLGGIELATSSLSGMRSNRLSYSPGEGEERTRGARDRLRVIRARLPARRP